MTPQKHYYGLENPPHKMSKPTPDWDPHLSAGWDTSAVPKYKQRPRQISDCAPVQTQQGWLLASAMLSKCLMRVETTPADGKAFWNDAWRS